MPPASLSGWSKSRLEPRCKRQKTLSLELGFMLDKPAWDRKMRPFRSNCKTALLPDKPAAGVEMWVKIRAQARECATRRSMSVSGRWPKHISRMFNRDYNHGACRHSGGYGIHGS
jgi:hypothetical protein